MERVRKRERESWRRGESKPTAREKRSALRKDQSFWKASMYLCTIKVSAYARRRQQRSTDWEYVVDKQSHKCQKNMWTCACSSFECSSYLVSLCEIWNHESQPQQKKVNPAPLCTLTNLTDSLQWIHYGKFNTNFHTFKHNYTHNTIINGELMIPPFFERSEKTLSDVGEGGWHEPHEERKLIHHLCRLCWLEASENTLHIQN